MKTFHIIFKCFDGNRAAGKEIQEEVNAPLVQQTL